LIKFIKNLHIKKITFVLILPINTQALHQRPHAGPRKTQTKVLSWMPQTLAKTILRWSKTHLNRWSQQVNIVFSKLSLKDPSLGSRILVQVTFSKPAFGLSASSNE